jgi:hypothetical protein
VAGYGIHADDGDIGHVQDFLVKDRTWAIRYLVVDTGNWWPGKHVLVAQDWICSVSWADRAVALPRATIRSATLRGEGSERPVRATEP